MTTDIHPVVKDAMARYADGYNCAQAVFVPAAIRLGMDEALAKRLASGLGGGVAGTGEICGAVMGMVLAMDLAEQSGDAQDAAAKAIYYQRLQALMARFSDAFGALRCQDLLEKHPKAPDTPRGESPCARFVEYAATLTAEGAALPRV